jgi:PAS domain S-box-containing protein
LREKAEKALSKSRRELESRVEARSREVTRLNRSLDREMRGREEARRDRDLTERNLSVLLDSLADGIVATDARGLVTRVNPQGEAILGRPGEEIRGRPLEDVLELRDLRDGSVLPDPLTSVLDRGAEQGSALEALVDAGDGETKVVAISGSAIREQGEGGGGIVLVLRDVSRERRLRRQLDKAQRLESIGRLAGGIAHDFNNLLTAILGSAEIARMDLSEDHPARAMVEDIVQSGEKATALTRQLLVFSRRQETSLQSVELNERLSELDRLLRRIIGEDVELVLSLDDEPGATRADPAQLEQVIVNLVVNARDAMPEGGRLEISTENRILGEPREEDLPNLEPGAYVILRVRDTGVGMSREVQQRIFDPFFTTKEEGKGTGLGLATVYGIVTQAGGAVRVESSPGQGTTFSVFLPRTGSPSGTSEADRKASPSLEGSETVLVVEDDSGVRQVVTSTLERFGYRVLSAGDGPDAATLCGELEEPLDLVVTDMILPSTDGHRVARDVREVWPEAGVLLMSGYREPEKTDGDGAPEDTAFIQKPFHPLDLMKRVREVLEA